MTAKKRQRDLTPINREDVVELSKNISNIVKLLSKADSEAWGWDDSKSEEMIAMALCHLSKTYKDANDLASNLSGLFQHVQGKTCSMTGKPSHHNTEDKALCRGWLKAVLVE